MIFSLKKQQKVKFKSADGGKTTDYGWIVKTILITFVLSVTFSAVSSGVMDGVSIWIAGIILLCIVCIGILFDMIGVAVTTADEIPFHSMAAQRVRGARQAIALIGARDKVSNFCNDVVGDICGIVSGSASAVVVTYVLTAFPSWNSIITGLGITGFVAALTVGGKAAGKTIAMSRCNTIVYVVASILAVFRFGEKKKSKPKKTSA